MTDRNIRTVSEREIAIALVLEYAEQDVSQFSMYGFYDDDADFIVAVAERLGVANNAAFVNKMRRVVRRLARYNVLAARTSSTHKEYVGEPTHQRNYWLQPGKVRLIQHEKGEHWMGAQGETEWLLRHAYPKADK